MQRDYTKGVKMPSYKTCNKCNGRCCEEFTILTIHYDGIMEGTIQTPDKKRDFIKDMIIFKNYSESGNRVILNCKHFDKISRMCLVYNDRPDMCKIFKCDKIPGRKGNGNK
ncbi:YkgJ family cysteine cluster protein [bacterium]|nr:YkgJ family cysteine cluster protein [bacterium]